MSENTETSGEGMPDTSLQAFTIKALQSELERLREENAKVTQCLDTALDREAKALNERDTAQKCVAVLTAVLRGMEVENIDKLQLETELTAHSLGALMAANIKQIQADLQECKLALLHQTEQKNAVIAECLTLKAEAEALRGEVTSAVTKARNWDYYQSEFLPAHGCESITALVVERDKLRGELQDALLGWGEVEQLTKRLRDAGYHNGMDVTPITLDEQITKLLADLERVTRERDEEREARNKWYAEWCRSDKTERSLRAQLAAHPDTVRVEHLQELIRHCPHTRFGFNDDEDAESPIGFSITTEGCETICHCGDTFAEAVDASIAYEATMQSESEGGKL
jgi:hypothetical protein